MKIFLTPKLIKEWSADEYTYSQGYLLYESGAVTETSFMKQGGVHLYSAKVTDGAKKLRVYAVFSENGIPTSYHCNCDAAYVWRGACKHVCAALCSLVHKDDLSARRRSYERSAANIISSLEKMALNAKGAAATMPSDEKVSLVPTFLCSVPEYNNDNPEIFISLQVGITHKYVVKNIGEFIKAMHEGATVSYGKKLTFTHIPQNLDEHSQALLSFIKAQAEQASDYLSSFTRSFDRHTYYISRDMPLSAGGLDQFFKMYENKRLNAIINGKNIQLLFSVEDAPIHYEIKDAGEEGIQLSGKNAYTVVRGFDHEYLLMEDVLYQINKEKFAVIEAIEKELTYANGYTTWFYAKDTGKFLSFVTPLLKRSGLADVAEIERKHHVRELNAKVYLDAADAGITAKTLFCYDDLEINALDKTETPQIHRDDLTEAAIKNTLTQHGFAEDKNGEFYTLSDVFLKYNFYKHGVNSLNALANVYATDDFKRKSQKAPYSRTTFGIRLKGDLLEIAPVNSNYSMKELIHIIDAWNAKKKFYPLKDGRFIDLTEADLTEEAHFLKALDLEERDVKDNAAKMSAGRALYVDSLISEENAAFFDRDGAFARIIADFNEKKEHGFAVPVSMEKTLRGYQKEGFKWLAMLAHYHFGGILADDMGLGKTIQVISLILYHKQTETEHKPSIVIAPTSLIYNWEREFQRFAPTINTYVIPFAAYKKRENIENGTDAVITTYDLLKRDIEFFKGFDYRFVIADEAQNIKNPITQNAKSVKTLEAKARFALTGTPIENSLSELWSIFDFVMPGFLRSYTRFNKSYEQQITKNRDQDAATALKKQISPFMLRRVKKDVLKDLPEKLRTNLYADMTDEQKKLYSAYHLKARGELLDIFDKNMMKESRIKILSFITRLRQICCHPGVFIDKYKGGSGKLSIVMETINNCIESGHRILLFSQFTSMLDIIIAEFKQEKIDYFYIDGATPAKQRNIMASRFNNGEKAVFLISLKAGGTGLNLTGADVVIHFDPWWNPAVMDQASDRAHRIGQKKVVQVFNVVAKDTIEEKIMALQEKKRDLTDLVIEGGANFINKLSPEELSELFA